MAEAGGARAIPQPAFTPQAVAQALEDLAGDPEELIAAAHAAWNCGRPDAAKDLADLVESFGGEPLMDVIRLGREAPRGAASAARPTSATAAREGSIGQ